MFDILGKLWTTSLNLFKQGQTYKGLAYVGATVLITAFPSSGVIVASVGSALLAASNTFGAINNVINEDIPVGGVVLDEANLDEEATLIPEISVVEE